MSTDEFAVLLSEVDNCVSAAEAELTTIWLSGIPNKKRFESVLILSKMSTVAHHFIAFSGVICPKSVLTMSPFCWIFSVFESPQVPQYVLPSALKAASMEAGARFSTADARAADAASS